MLAEVKWLKYSSIYIGREISAGTEPGSQWLVTNESDISSCSSWSLRNSKSEYVMKKYFIGDPFTKKETFCHNRVTF